MSGYSSVNNARIAPASPSAARCTRTVGVGVDDCWRGEGGKGEVESERIKRHSATVPRELRNANDFSPKSPQHEGKRLIIRIIDFL